MTQEEILEFNQKLTSMIEDRAILMCDLSCPQKIKNSEQVLDFLIKLQSISAKELR